MTPSPTTTDRAVSARPGLLLPREAVYWLLTIALLLGTGIFKGINLVAVLGYMMLLLWLGNAFLAGRQVRGLRGRRWIEGPVFARSKVTVMVTIENPLPHARIGVLIEDHGQYHDLEWFLPCLSPGEFAHPSGEVFFSRRGWYRWDALRACSGYPLGLVERGLMLAPPEPILVYPALGRVHRERLRRFLSAASSSPTESRLDPLRRQTARSEFHALRDYRPGDSPRWVHWRTSARRGALMVREFEEEPSENLLVVLDPWLPRVPTLAPGSLTEEGKEAARQARRRLETAVSLAATVCWDWCRQKGDHLTLAVAGADTPVALTGVTGPDHAALLMECLALVDGWQETDSTALLDRLAEMALPSGPVLLVSTRSSDFGDHLAERLRKSVACIQVDDLSQYDFYETEPPDMRNPAASARIPEYDAIQGAKS